MGGEEDGEWGGFGLMVMEGDLIGFVVITELRWRSCICIETDGNVKVVVGFRG